MDDAVDLAQNCPLWRLMSTFGATHSWWCLPEMMNISWIVWHWLSPVHRHS